MAPRSCGVRLRFCTCLVFLLCLARRSVAGDDPLARFVSDFADCRSVSSVNLFVSRNSSQFSTDRLAQMMLEVGQKKSRYATIHFLPLSRSALLRIIETRAGLVELVILDDDPVSCDFLLQVYDSGFLSNQLSWMMISTTGSIKQKLSTKYVPVNSQLIVGEVTWGSAGTALSVDLLEIYHLRADTPIRAVPVGRWEEDQGMTAWSNESIYERRHDWTGLELHITTVADPPFIDYFKQEDDIGGYIGELWKELAHVMKFSYRITYSVDEQWGSQLPDGNWTGVVGMLHRRDVEVSVTDLSVTEARSQVIDYSNGLQSLRLRMYIRKPTSLDVSWTTYLDVFDGPLWFVMVISIFIGAASMAGMYWVERWLKLREMREGNFGWSESLLHFFSATCQQGSENMPDGLGTRFFFWLFYMCMVTVNAAYSAMLVSFLAVQTVVLPFESVEGLMAAGTYRMGILRGTSQLDYFKLSPNPTYRELYKRFVDEMPNNAEGIRRVETEKFAFLDVHETASLSLPCHLISIERDYFVHMVALGFQKGSPYPEFFNFQLTRLKEMGLVSQKLSRWWHNSHSCGDDTLVGLGIPTVFSAFVLLVLGMGFGFLLLFAEMVYKRCRQRQQPPRHASPEKESMQLWQKLLQNSPQDEPDASAEGVTRLPSELWRSLSEGATTAPREDRTTPILQRKDWTARRWAAKAMLNQRLERNDADLPQISNSLYTENGL